MDTPNIACTDRERLLRAECDAWIRRCNALDAAINHHKRDTERMSAEGRVDERLWAARDRVRSEAANTAEWSVSARMDYWARMLGAATTQIATWLRSTTAQEIAEGGELLNLPVNEVLAEAVERRFGGAVDG